MYDSRGVVSFRRASPYWSSLWEGLIGSEVRKLTGNVAREESKEASEALSLLLHFLLKHKPDFVALLSIGISSHLFIQTSIRSL